jgi:uridine kinase
VTGGNVMEREHLLKTIAQMILGLARPGVLRVAVDGVDGAGKTVFADELAAVIRAAARTVIRASVDGFHNPKRIRYRLGRDSAEGFFRDSYNYVALKAMLLDPLSPGGSGRYCASVFDVNSDSAVVEENCVAAADAIFIFDGIFLHRPELRDYWDFSIFLDVAFDISIPRGAARGFGSVDPGSEQNRRYIEGQKLYFRECDPVRRATAVIDNNNLCDPRIVTEF